MILCVRPFDSFPCAIHNIVLWLAPPNFIERLITAYKYCLFGF